MTTTGEAGGVVAEKVLDSGRTRHAALLREAFLVVDEAGGAYLVVVMANGFCEAVRAHATPGAARADYDALGPVA